MNNLIQCVSTPFFETFSGVRRGSGYLRMDAGGKTHRQLAEIMFRWSK